jgi:septal ring factor EnvC (AmiA/AmiB activator)
MLPILDAFLLLAIERPPAGNPFVEVARLIGPWLLGPGVLGIVLWYLRDRKKDKAASTVAEGTVEADVRLKALSADQALVAYMEMAFASERAAKDRTIAEQNGQIQRQEQEIEDLRSDVQAQKAMIRRLNQKCDNLAAELTRLTGHPVEEC